MIVDLLFLLFFLSIIGALVQCTRLLKKIKIFHKDLVIVNAKLNRIESALGQKHLASIEEKHDM